MFGHHDDDQTQSDTANTGDVDTTGALDNSASAAPAESTGVASGPSLTPTATDETWGHPGSPLDDNSNASSAAPAADTATTDTTAAQSTPNSTALHTAPAVTPVSNSTSSSLSSPAPEPAKSPAPSPAATTPAVAAGADSHELVDLKQKALGQLSPLVGKLDQSPEEKFRTLMMMIQASDDQSLLKEAYEAAEQITDEKTKAQALLDVVNEINYFTHQTKG